MTTQLNLPIWNANSKSVDRVGAARANAYKKASDIVKSIPNNENNAELLHKVMNKMLASGSIKSLEEFYELTGSGNPNPNKAENESSLNSSGYTVVNGSTFLKLYTEAPNNSDNYNSYGNFSLIDNVEAIRMLYVAGLSITSIRRELEKLKEGDVYVAKCKKVLKKYPKLSFYEILDKYPDFRGYPEYLINHESNTYAVCDDLYGKDSTYILYVKQDFNDTALLSCKPTVFPVKGEMIINANNIDYTYEIDATDSFSLLSQLNSVESPISFSYDEGLTISSKVPFYFKKTEKDSLLRSLRILEALSKAKESLYLGYSGVELIDGEFPYNIVIKKTGYSKSNTRKIYNNLKDNGIDDYICDCFITGKSIYYTLESSALAIQKAIKENPFAFDSISSYEDSYYKYSNVRILGTTLQTINKLLKMSNEDLEYLLRYRLDVTSIDPYCSNEEARDAMIKAALSSSTGSSYYKKETTETDKWKLLTSNARTVYFYIEMAKFNYKSIGIKESSDKYSGWLDTTYEFLDSAILYYNKDFLKSYEKANETYKTDETLGMNIATTINWQNSLSFAKGLQSFISIRSKIDTSFLDEFEQDMLVIQAYLDAALSAFNGVCSKIASIIKILNSSLAITSDIGGSFALDGGSLLQCSLSVDLGLNIPVYIPFINDILIGLIEMLEAAIQAVVDLENAILCPIQNLLDKYVNTSNFVLPCKISYSVPVISGLEAYLQGYLNALANLKALCRVTKRDGDWVKFKCSQMPGSISLLVTKSDECKE